MAGGDGLQHGQPHQLGQDRGAGQKKEEEDLHRGGGEGSPGEPFLKVPQALGARDHHVSEHSAAGEGGRACLVLQQKTKREKNDASGGPSPVYGRRIFTGGDPPSSSHATESCAVTVFMNNVVV